MSARLPRLRPSTLPAAEQCPRRFARAVAGTGLTYSPRPHTDRRFALQNAVVDAARRAHAQADADGGPPSDALAAEPMPDELEPEERIVFTEALERYGAIADARGGRVPPDAPRPWLQRASATGRYEVSIVLDVVLATDEGTEVRRLAFAPPRVDDLADDPRARLTALVLGANPVLRYAHLDLRAGQVHEVAVDEATRQAWGAQVQATVLAALDDPDPPARPGIWCGSCEAVRGCPAVPAGDLADLVGPAARPPP